MSAAIVEAVPVVQRVCRQRLRGLTHPALTWEDVVQTALVSLLTAQQQHPGAAVTSGLAATNAGWRCVDAQRASGREIRGVPLDELGEHPAAKTAGPEELALAADLRRRLRSLLAEVLTDQERAVVFCRLWLDLSAIDTAAALGTTPGAVRIAHHRAVRRLRARLAGGAL